ncbi:MAG: hypothetical protein WBL65_02820 [Bryobacteraceae bacterium]
MTDDPLTALRGLEAKLRDSHSRVALDAIQGFSEQLKSTTERLSVFNADRAIVREPILSDETRALGFDQPEDDFTFLQGDVVATESAYFLGERISGFPKYVLLSSSCDLVPTRREVASLLRVSEIRRSDPEAKASLSLLLRFKRSSSMYLPLLPADDAGVICNVINFDGICQIRSSDLALANRLASLSLVGWRIFAAFSRVVVARANPRETEMRSSLEQNLFTI